MLHRLKLENLPRGMACHPLSYAIHLLKMTGYKFCEGHKVKVVKTVGPTQRLLARIVTAFKDL